MLEHCNSWSLLTWGKSGDDAAVRSFYKASEQELTSFTDNNVKLNYKRIKVRHYSLINSKLQSNETLQECGNSDSASSHHRAVDYFPITAWPPNVLLLTYEECFMEKGGRCVWLPLEMRTPGLTASKSCKYENINEWKWRLQNWMELVFCMPSETTSKKKKLRIQLSSTL